MGCDNCKKKDGEVASVPYLYYESSMARNERTVRRLIVALIVAVSMIFASNFAWLYYWNQYDYESEESVTVDAKDGIANYIGGMGDIVNGSDSG